MMNRIRSIQAHVRGWDWIKIRRGLVSVAFGLVCLVAFLGVAGAYTQSKNNQALIQKSITVSNRHHAQVAAQNRIIIGQNKEILKGEAIITYGESILNAVLNEHTITIQQISTLQQQLTDVLPVLNGLPAADAELGTLAKALIEDVNQLCAVDNRCAQIPVPS